MAASSYNPLSGCPILLEFTMPTLEEKLIRMYQQPEIQAHSWEPRLFWKEIDARHPFGALKVDPAREVTTCRAVTFSPPMRGVMSCRC
jgi:hypothetical protein